MGANTKIEWCHHTFNPWLGCSKVAAGCAHCYAEAFAKRTGKTVWGPGGLRVKTSEAYWRSPLKWDRWAAEGICPACGGSQVVKVDGQRVACDQCVGGRVEPYRARVFCASMADVFEEWPGSIHSHDGLELTLEDCRRDGFPGTPMEMVREDLFDLIDRTPNLDWLLLTKRPENIERRWRVPAMGEVGRNIGQWRHGWWRPNVWLGCSIATQEDADRNLPHLFQCRELSPVLFISAEPLLGPVLLPRTVAVCPNCGKDPQAIGFRSDPATEPFAYYCSRPSCRDRFPLPSIDWVICGGESGHQAAPMRPGWARSLRDQCQAAGVPFLFKQWGEWAPYPDVGTAGLSAADILGDRMAWVAPDGRWSVEQILPEDFPASTVLMSKVGKKAAGRLLDGRLWDALPEVAAVV